MGSGDSAVTDDYSPFFVRGATNSEATSDSSLRGTPLPVQQKEGAIAEEMSQALFYANLFSKWAGGAVQRGGVRIKLSSSGGMHEVL